MTKASLSADTMPARRRTSYRETGIMLAVLGAFIVVAHGADILSTGTLNPAALVIRLAWGGTLLLEAVALSRAGWRVIRVVGTVAAAVTTISFLLLVQVTGGADAPVVWFGYVLAVIMPLFIWELTWQGFLGSAALVVGLTALLLPGAEGGGRVGVIHVGLATLACGALLGRSFIRSRTSEEAATIRLEEAVEANERLVTELRQALANVRTLEGLLPICAWCGKARTDHGYWQQLDAYVAARTGVKVTHSLCPDCAAKEFGAVEAADGLAETPSS